MKNARGQFTKIVRDMAWVENHSTPVTECGCWLWDGYVNPKSGYGVASTREKLWRAHRLVFKIANGYLPKIVMHKCDNRMCVNPDHLEAGTQKKNLQDMVDRGRGGSSMFVQRVSDRVRKEIFHAGGTQVSIAEDYGVDPSLVSRIKSNTDRNRTRFGG